ncbi:MAG: sigma-54-dependent Fis family transcriptional regulator, partial [Vicinamibacteria bacterium]|nr:sigma-54-dependent Fis family transcriptional regulator [Vicinamibacteria bacterium]
VRELENMIARMVVLAGCGPITREHLAPHLAARETRPARSLRDARLAFEREHIQRVLLDFSGNRMRAAATLGMTRQGLLAKIRQIGLS